MESNQKMALAIVAVILVAAVLVIGYSEDWFLGTTDITDEGTGTVGAGSLWTSDTIHWIPDANTVTIGTVGDLTIEEGTTVYLDGNIIVYGTLIIETGVVIKTSDDVDEGSGILVREGAVFDMSAATIREQYKAIRFFGNVKARISGSLISNNEWGVWIEGIDLTSGHGIEITACTFIFNTHSLALRNVESDRVRIHQNTFMRSDFNIDIHDLNPLGSQTSTVEIPFYLNRMYRSPGADGWKVRTNRDYILNNIPNLQFERWTGSLDTLPGQEMGSWWQENEDYTDTNRDGIDDSPYVTDAISQVYPDGSWSDEFPFYNINYNLEPDAYFEVDQQTQGLGSGNTEPFLGVSNFWIVFTPTLLQGAYRGQPTTIVSVEWDFGDGTTMSCPDVTDCPNVNSFVVHRYSTKGTYTVSVTVTDDRGFSNIPDMTLKISDDENDQLKSRYGTIWSDQRSLNIREQDAMMSGFINIVPCQGLMVEHGSSVIRLTKPQTVTLDAANSYNEITSETRYSWTVTFDSSTILTSSDSMIMLDVSDPGEYDVDLDITEDSDTPSFSDSTTIIVELPADQPPIIVLGAGSDPVAAELGEPITNGTELTIFDNEMLHLVSASYDPEEADTFQTIYWGDNTSSAYQMPFGENITASHQYAPGEYNISLKVGDNPNPPVYLNFTLTVLDIEERETVEREAGKEVVEEKRVYGPMIIGVILALVVIYLLYRWNKQDFPIPGVAVLIVGVIVVAATLLIDYFIFAVTFTP